MNSSHGGEVTHSYRDVLPVFLGNFRKDFECNYVEDTLRKIFNKKVVDDIMKSPLTHQIFVLFWKLHEQPSEKLNQFVEDELNSQHNYDFLMSAIRAESRNPTESTRNYISERDRLYNDNQRFSKYNVPRIEPYLELRQALLELRPSRNVVVGGVLGAGKQWLALDVCSSYDVQRKMDFKIFWLNVRDCRSPEKRLEMLQSFLYQIAPNMRINGGPSVEGQIERLKTELRHLIKNKSYKNCLLVLRNVQNKETWEAFNLGCKILLTTRHNSVINYLSPETTKHVTLPDVLTPSETETLFGKYLSTEPHELAKLETRNPLRLSWIAKNIRDGLCTLDNWKNMNCSKLTTIIQNSLNELQPLDKEMFEMLFIFPESAYIPIRLLGLVWSVYDPENVVNRFYKYSLVEKHSDATITLPSIYSECHISIPNEAALSKKIVDNYDIPRIFNKCNDLTLENLDCYFYSHIGHHLSKICDRAERVNLFRMIFLDFRFLEHKIRNDKTDWNFRGSILHTLHILKSYKDQIVDNDNHYRDLLNDLLIFLTKAEEKLLASQYTNLLQIALMSTEGPVHDEALRQVQRFPNFVWFTEHGRFHQHREIINSGKDQVRHVKYLNDDYCLMALSSKQLRVADVSLEGDATYLLSDDHDPSDIIKVHVYNKQSHFLTLHKNGSLKLWSLRKLLPLRKVRPTRHSQAARDTESHGYEQSINSSVGSKSISAFYIDEIQRAGVYTIQLHVAFEDGGICILNWNDVEKKFIKSQTPILKTKQTVIRHFYKILNRFYVVWSDNYKLTFWDLQNGSDVTNVEYAPQGKNALAMETYIETLENGEQFTIMLIIYEQSIWQLRFKHTEYCQSLWAVLDPPQLLKISKKIPATITCGKLSTDGRYLIIGTLQGLVVYDLKSPFTLLRSNVSDHIVCLDLYDLNHSIMKYIVLCGVNDKHFLHVHTLRSTTTDDLIWMHHVDESDDQLKDRNTLGRARLEPNVYLHALLEKSKDGTLYTVDSRDRIHQIQPIMGHSNGRRDSVAKWSTIATPKYECGTYITALCVHDDGNIYAGYNNGHVINVIDNNILVSMGEISYLKVVNFPEPRLIASDYNKTAIITLSTKETFLHKMYTTYARVVYDQFLMLFTVDCGLVFLNESQNYEHVFERLYGFDLKADQLYLATRDGTLEIYKILVEEHRLHFSLICKENIKDSINQLRVSHDGQLIAIGFKNGTIELYSFEKPRVLHIYTISQGHDTCNSMQLRFSPCKQILVSCGEQLCFWNMQHILNNQAIPEPRSRRHNLLQEQLQAKGREEVDAARFAESSYKELMSPPRNYVQVAENKASVWTDKSGNDKLPELLACIKFVGNEARRFYASVDFTQFFVIDNEGVFYHQKVLENNSLAQSCCVLDHKLDQLRFEQIQAQEDSDSDDNGNRDDYNYDDNGVDVVGDIVPDRQSDLI